MTNIQIHIGEMLARNARMYPNDVALIERIPAEKKRNTITWREFDERANRFSNALRSRGIKKGDKIIHLMNNSIDWLVVYFGIIRTGGGLYPSTFALQAMTSSTVAMWQNRTSSYSAKNSGRG